MAIEHASRLGRSPQSGPETCGQACLAVVYDVLGIGVDIREVLGSVEKCRDGGTMVFSLGADAATRGLSAEIVTCDVARFDPTWSSESMTREVEASLRSADDRRTVEALASALSFLEAGGSLHVDARMGRETVETAVSGGPAIAGVSMTALYEKARERRDGSPDPKNGAPVGHFVVVDAASEKGVSVWDPFSELPGDPLPDPVPWNRFVAALLLGALTRDGCLLTVRRP